MRLWLENLKESLPENCERRLQAIRVLDNEIDRLDRVVKRFLDFTRPMNVPAGTFRCADAGEVIGMARPRMERANVESHGSCRIDLPEVCGDHELLRQAMLNPVLNAGKSMPSDGQLRILLAGPAKSP